MRISINMAIDIEPQEMKDIVKMAKKLGCAELLQQVAPAVTSAPTPATEPELPVGTFTGGEEIPAPVEDPDPTPAPKRGRKPKATLGFR